MDDEDEREEESASATEDDEEDDEADDEEDDGVQAQAASEGDQTDEEDSDGGGHGEAELHEIPGVVVTSSYGVVQGGVSSPGHPVVGGEGARPPGLVEQQGEVQHLAVAVGGGVVGLVALVGSWVNILIQYSHTSTCLNKIESMGTIHFHEAS